MLILETRRPGRAGFCRAPLSHIDRSGCWRKTFGNFSQMAWEDFDDSPHPICLDSSLPFSLRASLVRAGPRSFTVQTFGLLIPARTLW